LCSIKIDLNAESVTIIAKVCAGGAEGIFSRP
jgi:hypothetical protein